MRNTQLSIYVYVVYTIPLVILQQTPYISIIDQGSIILFVINVLF